MKADEARLNKLNDQVQLYARQIAIDFLHWYEYPVLDIERCTIEFDEWRFKQEQLPEE